MVLTKKHVIISDACFSSESKICDGKLYIDKEDVERQLLCNEFAGVELQIAKPGESVRLTNVGDIIQPVAKSGCLEDAFPGFTGSLKLAGTGETVCLDGIAVAEIAELPLMQSSIIDMSGAGAEQTPFSGMILTALVAAPAEKTDKNEYLLALKRAACRLAVILAKLALDIEADHNSEYCFDTAPRKTNLPRVCYIYQIFAHKNMIEPFFYGSRCQQILPFTIDPNEVLDGAMINLNYDLIPFSDTTYTIQNHPVIEELFKRDGKSVDFCGVVMVNASSTIEDKTLSSMRAVFLAKEALHADYAVLTKEGGGHTQVDIELVCDYCAQMGIKPVIIIAENVSTNGRTDEAVLFNTENANAMISAGCLDMVQLCEMDRLIGHTPITDMENMADLRGQCSIYNKYIRGALSQLGASLHTSYKY